jgi:hypothetical protein
MEDEIGKLRRVLNLSAASALALTFTLTIAGLPLLAGQNQPDQAAATVRQSAADTAQPPTVQTPEPEFQRVPPALTLKAGTVITARVSQWLSSDKNHAGDSFSAELEQPVVVDGWVVARRGQTVLGRVAVAQKAGRVKGVSQLGVELSKVILVDGQQLAIRSQLLKTSGGTSKGRDAEAAGTATAVGAAIGGTAHGGEGAGMGAAIGAGAGLAGVLLTRGRPTVIPPETSLTFQLQYPITISTARSGPAFRQVVPEDYNPGTLRRRSENLAGVPYGPPPPYYYSPWYGLWGYPGPLFIGFYGYGGGFRHGGFRH